MSGNDESEKLQRETSRQLSLAELSRQYLYGNVGIEEYLAIERQLTPHYFDEALKVRISIEQINSKTQAHNSPLTNTN
jgi:hypothetical protein